MYPTREQALEELNIAGELNPGVWTDHSRYAAQAAELIAAGKVSLDHVPCDKTDKPVACGAIITARGFGKAVVRECDRVSKKGRIILVMDRFV